jgi:hypothetical protein
LPSLDVRTASPIAGATPGAAAREREDTSVDQLLKDARRLASVGTFFIVVGWVFIAYALIAGLVWWIDLASSDSFNFIEALAVSAYAVGLPIFSAFLVGGIGYAMRLIALYISMRQVATTV